MELCECEKLCGTMRGSMRPGVGNCVWKSEELHWNWVGGMCGELQ